MAYQQAFAEVNKNNNGWNFISGKGCGTITPIKFFNNFPLDISGLTCAMIKPQDFKISKNYDLFKGIKNPDEMKNWILGICTFKDTKMIHM